MKDKFEGNAALKQTLSTGGQAVYKVAYLVSHPIQYQAPLLRSLAACAEIDLTVFFLSDFSIRGYQDPGFGASIEWDVPLLDGYKSVFLPAWGGADRVSALKPWSRGLGQHLRREKFDALWLHGYAHPVNLRAMMIARRAGIKVLVRAESQLGSAARTRATKGLKEAVVRRVFAGVDAFLSIGTLNQAYYRHYGVPSEKIFPVPYAVDNAFFQSKAQAAHSRREALRAELGLEPGRPIILFASKFIARKRAGDLLEAFIRLSPNGIHEPDPYLLFIGDGEERPLLEERVRQLGWSSSVRFLGFKNQTELPAYYDLCDVFALVSEREPWGLIVNEVMNAGKALIVSDQVGAGPDLVRDGRNGFVVPVGDIKEISGRLREITSDRDLAARMGEQSREMIDHWSFCEDREGLLQALAATVGRAEAVR